MPRYVKEDRVIFASYHAYKTLYEDQGFLPLKDENEEQKELVAPSEVPEIEEVDDYSDDEETDVTIDPNDAVPLAARVAMLSYEELKAKAKELGIPKYANTKRDDLVNLIVDKLEVSSDK